MFRIVKSFLPLAAVILLAGTAPAGESDGAQDIGTDAGRSGQSPTLPQIIRDTRDIAQAFGGEPEPPESTSDKQIAIAIIGTFGVIGAAVVTGLLARRRKRR